MPIEFQCPKCETLVRVGDDAAGKKGRCPQCQAKLRVPHVVPPPPPPPVPAPLAAPGKIEFQCPQCQAVIGVPESAAGLTGNCPQCGITLQVPAAMPRPLPVAASYYPAPTPAPAPPPGFPQDPFAIDTSESVSSANTSVAAQLRKRQKGGSKSTTVMFVSVVAIAGLLGAGWWYFRPAPAPKLAGELTAEQLPKFATPAVEIDPDLITLKRNLLVALQQFLRDSPLKLRSSLMTMAFEPTENSLQVRVSAGEETQFVRVDPSQDETLANYLKKNAARMDGPRQKELRDSLPVFYEAVEVFRKKDGATTADLADYRGSVGISALVRGFGYHVDAAYRGEVHRCVYEDPEGRLYFLLPAAAKSFELRGRDIPNDPIHFPGLYKVAIERTPGRRATVEEDSTDEPAPRKPARKKRRSAASEESADESADMQAVEASGEMAEEEEPPASKKRTGPPARKRKSEPMLTEDDTGEEEMSESMAKKPSAAKKRKTDAMMSDGEAEDEEMMQPPPNKKKKKPQIDE